MRRRIGNDGRCIDGYVSRRWRSFQDNIFYEVVYDERVEHLQEIQVRQILLDSSGRTSTSASVVDAGGTTTSDSVDDAGPATRSNSLVVSGDHGFEIFNGSMEAPDYDGTMRRTFVESVDALSWAAHAPGIASENTVVQCQAEATNEVLGDERDPEFTPELRHVLEEVDDEDSEERYASDLRRSAEAQTVLLVRRGDDGELAVALLGDGHWNIGQVVPEVLLRTSRGRSGHGVTNGFCKQASMAARTLRALALGGIPLMTGGAVTIEVVSVWHHDPASREGLGGILTRRSLRRQPWALVVASLDRLARMRVDFMNVIEAITRTRGLVAVPFFFMEDEKRMLNAGATLRDIVNRRLDIGEATVVGLAIYTGRYILTQIIQARLHAWGIGYPCPLLSGISETLKRRLGEKIQKVILFGRTSPSTNIRANKSCAGQVNLLHVACFDRLGLDPGILVDRWACGSAGQSVATKDVPVLVIEKTLKELDDAIDQAIVNGEADSETVGIVAVTAFDRGARDLEIWTRIVQDFRGRHVEVVALTPPRAMLSMNDPKEFLELSLGGMTDFEAFEPPASFVEIVGAILAMRRGQGINHGCVLTPVLLSSEVLEHIQENESDVHSLFLHVYDNSRAWSHSAQGFDKLRELRICSDTGGSDDRDVEIGPVLTDEGRRIVLEIFEDEAPLALDAPAGVAGHICRCVDDPMQHSAECRCLCASCRRSRTQFCPHGGNSCDWVACPCLCATCQRAHVHGPLPDGAGLCIYCSATIERRARTGSFCSVECCREYSEVHGFGDEIPTCLSCPNLCPWGAGPFCSYACQPRRPASDAELVAHVDFYLSCRTSKDDRRGDDVRPTDGGALAAALEHALESRRRPPEPRELELILKDLHEVRLRGLWSFFKKDETLLRERVAFYFEHVAVRNAETIIYASHRDLAFPPQMRSQTTRGDLVALDDTALFGGEVISDAAIADALRTLRSSVSAVPHVVTNVGGVLRFDLCNDGPRMTRETYKVVALLRLDQGRLVVVATRRGTEWALETINDLFDGTKEALRDEVVAAGEAVVAEYLRATAMETTARYEEPVDKELADFLRAQGQDVLALYECLMHLDVFPACHKSLLTKTVSRNTELRNQRRLLAFRKYLGVILRRESRPPAGVPTLTRTPPTATPTPPTTTPPTTTPPTTTPPTTPRPRRRRTRRVSAEKALAFFEGPQETERRRRQCNELARMVRRGQLELALQVAARNGIDPTRPPFVWLHYR